MLKGWSRCGHPTNLKASSMHATSFLHPKTKNKPQSSIVLKRNQNIKIVAWELIEESYKKSNKKKRNQENQGVAENDTCIMLPPDRLGSDGQSESLRAAMHHERPPASFSAGGTSGFLASTQPAEMRRSKICWRLQSDFESSMCCFSRRSLSASGELESCQIGESSGKLSLVNLWRDSCLPALGELDLTRSSTSSKQPRVSLD